MIKTTVEWKITQRLRIRVAWAIYYYAVLDIYVIAYE